MSLTVTPITPGFGAEISGIDLSQAVSDTEVKAIEAVLDEYGVVVFHDQPLSEDAQVTFTLRFGPLDLGLKKAVKAAKTSAPQRLKHDEMIDISNLDSDGKVVGRDHQKIINNIANQLWHSDSSFQAPSARYSMLSAQSVAGRGGDTEFTDLRAAYDALDDYTKAEIADLVAEHYALHSRLLLGDDGWTQEQRDALPRVEWPIVRTHAGSGRKLLFVGAHCSRIVGRTVAEGRMLLQDLLEHATQPAFVYKHKWRVNDLVIWDNRATLHRGRRFDLTQRREMRRSTTLDVN